MLTSHTRLIRCREVVGEDGSGPPAVRFSEWFGPVVCRRSSSSVRSFSMTTKRRASSTSQSDLVSLVLDGKSPGESPATGRSGTVGEAVGGWQASGSTGGYPSAWSVHLLSDRRLVESPSQLPDNLNSDRCPWRRLAMRVARVLALSRSRRHGKPGKPGRRRCGGRRRIER